MTIGLRLALAAGAALVLLTACGDDSNSAGNRDQTQVNAPDRRTVISTINVEVETVEVVERSIGQVSSRTAPSLIAEVDGKKIRLAEGIAGREAGEALREAVLRTLRLV